MVADYNSRCGQFRYRRGSLESAKSQVSPFTADLQNEGVSRFPPSTSSGGALVSNSASDNHSPKYLNAESLSADEEKSLVEILSSSASSCSRGSTCEFGEFSLTPVNLDSDGTTQYLVTPNGYCGSGGCTTFLFTNSEPAGWHQVASAFGFLSIGKRWINGHRTLIVATKVYRPGGGFDEAAQEYSWAGNGYVLASK